MFGPHAYSNQDLGSATDALAGAADVVNTVRSGITKWTRARSNSRDLLNRAGELSFERSVIVHLLRELALTKALFIKDFKTDTASARDTFCGESKACLVNLRFWNTNRRAAIIDLVRNV